MTVSDIAHTQRFGTPGAWRGTVLRYGASAVGPMAVSAAHFIASLIFLRNLPANEFGLFSFVMVVVSFGMGLNASLIVVPITRDIVTGEDSVRPVCFQMNWVPGFSRRFWPAARRCRKPPFWACSPPPLSFAGSAAASPTSMAAWRPPSSRISPTAGF